MNYYILMENGGNKLADNKKNNSFFIICLIKICLMRMHLRQIYDDIK